MNLKKLNTAEVFSLVRIVTFPIVLLFILLHEREISAWLYIILFSTDAIDGFFAFFFNMESDRRAKLDTWGDILFLLVGVIGFYIFEQKYFLEHALWIVLTLGAYLLQLIIALFKYKKPTNFHTYIAKIAAFFQVIFLAFVLFFYPISWLLYFTVALSLVDVIEEIILLFILPRYKANVKGLYWVMKQK